MGSRVVVVGAGISGAACARELQAAGHDVHLVERGRTPGGRMASRTLADRPVDLGASYLTASDDAFQAQVDDWLARGLARPWTRSFATATADGVDGSKDGPLRYGAPAGLRSLVEDLCAGLEVRTLQSVIAVGPGPTVDGAAADAVVLAMPDPQAQRLLDPALAEARAALAERTWEPSLALAAGFASRTWSFDGCFVNDHPVLSWVADDGSRRGDGAPVLVAHSTGPFAVPRLTDPQAAGPELVAALREVVGLDRPEWTCVHRWSFSKPEQGREEPFALVENGTVGLCGDGWGASKVQAAWLSGHLLGRELAARLP